MHLLAGNGWEPSLKVIDLKTMVVQNEEPYIGGRYVLFLELITDEGITGLGERITGKVELWWNNHVEA